MDLPFSVKDLGLGVGLPVLIAAAIGSGIRLAPKWGVSRLRQSMAIPFGVAFILGCWFIKLTEWAPTQHWHWIFYATIGACLCSGIAATKEVTWYEQVGLFACAAFCAAWFLVPTWKTLEPPRRELIIGFAMVVSLTAYSIEFVAARRGGIWLGIWMSAIALTASILMMLAGSALFSQVGLAIFGASVGCTIAGSWKRDANPQQGWGLVFAMSLVGILLISKVQTFFKIPISSFLVLVAPFPLMMLLEATLGKKLPAKYVILIQAILGLLGCICAILIAVNGDPTIIQFEEDGY